MMGGGLSTLGKIIGGCATKNCRFTLNLGIDFCVGTKTVGNMRQRKTHCLTKTQSSSTVNMASDVPSPTAALLSGINIEELIQRKDNNEVNTNEVALQIARAILTKIGDEVVVQTIAVFVYGGGPAFTSEKNNTVALLL